MEPWRLGLGLLLGLLLALLVDWLCARRGLLPPGFHGHPGAPVRRGLAVVVLALLFAVTIGGPLASLGVETGEPDLSQMSSPQLFLLHCLMLIALGAWFLLGFAGAGAGAGEGRLGRRFAEQLGLVAPSVPREIGIGVVTGLIAWLVVLSAIIAFAFLIMAVGGEDALPKRPPALIPWIAGQPFWLRLLVSLSAGVVEELFFRGFLQPRVGIVLSTAVFAVAHLSYGQPFLLVGITLLSLAYAFLVRWRQSVWAAMIAHWMFDAIQLLVMVPAALKLMEAQGQGGAGTAAWLGLLPL
ncbi:MAG TPA: CPBP family intramembrane glutamic endopeptidase [Thermoanaerobaculia bacterium]|nr:CPBP family intramembrane glutamic endopeptidase [Thermoanaerobaculia bacterium]